MKHFADLLLNKNNSKSNDQVPFIQRRRGIEIKYSREINLMKKSSRIVGTVLREINDLIKPGMSTKDLDNLNIKDEEFVFHAGTKMVKGKTFSNGGRVLNFVKQSESYKKSREGIILLINNLKWENGFYRKDIGYKAIDK